MPEREEYPNQPGITHKDIHEGAIEAHIAHIGKEFREGFQLLQQYPKSVTIFGSSQLPNTHPDYLKAEELARKIVSELKYTVITGAGPGIMEAASKGAFEAGGVSAGLSISLPHEHKVNAYTTSKTHFSYFFIRKTMLTFAAEAYIFFPGGFGTFDELFSILTLVQTGKIPKVPILLYDSKFWNKFKHFLQTTMKDEYHNIDDRDLALFEITDSFDHILERIRTSPVSSWWRNIN
jgi:uncharacterized protein (TIGR00730 family)